MMMAATPTFLLLVTAIAVSLLCSTTSGTPVRTLRGVQKWRHMPPRPKAGAPEPIYVPDDSRPSSEAYLILASLLGGSGSLPGDARSRRVDPASHADAHRSTLDDLRTYRDAIIAVPAERDASGRRRVLESLLSPPPPSPARNVASRPAFTGSSERQRAASSSLFARDVTRRSDDDDDDRHSSGRDAAEKRQRQQRGGAATSLLSLTSPRTRDASRRRRRRSVYTGSDRMTWRQALESTAVVYIWRMDYSQACVFELTPELQAFLRPSEVDGHEENHGYPGGTGHGPGHGNGPAHPSGNRPPRPPPGHDHGNRPQPRPPGHAHDHAHEDKPAHRPPPGPDHGDRPHPRPPGHAHGHSGPHPHGPKDSEEEKNGSSPSFAEEKEIVLFDGAVASEHVHIMSDTELATQINKMNEIFNYILNHDTTDAAAAANADYHDTIFLSDFADEGGDAADQRVGDPVNSKKVAGKVAANAFEVADSDESRDVDEVDADVAAAHAEASTDDDVSEISDDHVDGLAADEDEDDDNSQDAGDEDDVVPVADDDRGREGKEQNSENNENKEGKEKDIDDNAQNREGEEKERSNNGESREGNDKEMFDNDGSREGKGEANGDKSGEGKEKQHSDDDKSSEEKFHDVADDNEAKPRDDEKEDGDDVTNTDNNDDSESVVRARMRDSLSHMSVSEQMGLLKMLGDLMHTFTYHSGSAPGVADICCVVG